MGKKVYNKEKLNFVMKQFFLFSGFCLFFVLFLNIVFATPTTISPTISINRTLISNDSIYLLNEQYFLKNSFFYFSPEFLLNLDNFSNESVIKIYFRSAKGTEIILGQDTLKNLINEEIYFILEPYDTTQLLIGTTTQSSLKGNAFEIPLCSPDKVEEAISILNKKVNPSEFNESCYYYKIRYPKESLAKDPEGFEYIKSPQLNISKIYDYGNKDELDNSSLILQIDDSVYREYLLRYNPGYMPTSPNDYSIFNDIIPTSLIIIFLTGLFLILTKRRKSRIKSIRIH